MEEIIKELNFLGHLSYVQRDEQRIKLQNLLNDLPLIKMKYRESICMLIKILMKCNELDLGINIVELVFERWSGHEFDPDGVIGDLAANAACPIHILRYLRDIFTSSCPMTILDTHIRTRYGSGMYFGLVANRILEMYEIENLDVFEWQQLYDAVNDIKDDYLNNPNFFNSQKYDLTRDNKDILDYIDIKMNEHKTKEIAPIPKWISLQENETEKTFENLCPGKNQSSNDTEINKILSVISSVDKNKENISLESISEVCVSLQNNYSNENLAERYYGPANAIVNKNCCFNYTNDPSVDPVGPCRMFSCCCRENDDDDNETNYMDFDTNVINFEKAVNYWFSGECDICHKSIEKFRYAVRFPVSGGGWLGCFCSFGCMSKYELRPIGKKEKFRISEIKYILESKGIVDL